MYFNTPLEAVLFFDEVLEVAALMVDGLISIPPENHLRDMLELSPEFPSGFVGTFARISFGGC